MSGRLFGVVPRMTGFALRALALLSLLPLPAAAQAPERQAPAKFRSAVDVVSISAVVRDRKGRFVRDLVKKDFLVADSGEPRHILDFRAESDGPVKLALLFDVSGSMSVGVKAIDARQTAKQLVSALRPTDAAAVFAFDTRLRRVSKFTSDLSSLDSSLERVDEPYGQTSLYDAIAETARVVADEGRGDGRLPQRAAVVVLTDGIDTRSRLTASQVSSIASLIDIPIYIIAVMTPIDDVEHSGDDAPVDDAAGLRSLARWTGGELFTASAPAHASIAARQVVDELRHQYVLAFEASSRAGWRSLDVRARDRALVVRARAGYTSGGTS
jgi:VWFA-related protein